MGSTPSKEDIIKAAHSWVCCAVNACTDYHIRTIEDEIHQEVLDAMTKEARAKFIVLLSAAFDEETASIYRGKGWRD